MLGLYGLLILGLAATFATRPIPARLGNSLSRPLGLGSFSAIACALVAITAWHEHLVALAADEQAGMPSWLATLPALPVMDLQPYTHSNLAVANAVEITSVLEVVLLVTLVCVTFRRRFTTATVVVASLAAGAMALIAARAHGILSPDVYAYIGDGLLGLQAYQPHPHLFVGAFEPIAKLWGDPPLPCAYGPAWLFPATLLMRGVHTLSDGLFRFRLAGIACIILVWTCLARLRCPITVLLTFVLNPAVWMQYAADAHNDLWPIALLLAGRVFAKMPVAAALFGGLAGAAKLPFIVFGVLAGADAARRADRLKIAAGSVFLGVAFSAAFGGLSYLRAVETIQRAYASADPSSLVIHALGLAGASAAVGLAVMFRRVAWAAAFSFAVVAISVLPWYAIWGLPYATLGDGADIFLCLLPLAAFMTATTYATTVLWPPLIVTVFIVALAYAYALLSGRRFAL